MKNWCFWTVVLEKTLESPLDCKEIQPVHPKGDQSWCSLEGLMLKLKLQYFGHFMQTVDSLEKTLMLGGIGGRRRRGRQRMRWLDGITDLMDVEFEWTPGVGDGQGGLACCYSWDRKETDTTEWLNWMELKWYRMWASRVARMVKKPSCQCRKHKRGRFNPLVRKVPWSSAEQSTPISLPGESHGQRRLVGYSPRHCKESDMTEVT